MKTLTSLSLAAVASVMPLAELVPSAAGSDYCHRNMSGNYVCIQSVFGPRHYRGMVWTLNGYVNVSKRINCYEYDYEPTSLTAVACWSYTPLKNEPLETPEPSKVPEDIKAIMTGGGFIDEDKAIDIEKIKKAFPDKMK